MQWCRRHLTLCHSEPSAAARCIFFILDLISLSFSFIILVWMLVNFCASSRLLMKWSHKVRNILHWGCTNVGKKIFENSYVQVRLFNVWLLRRNIGDSEKVFSVLLLKICVSILTYSVADWWLIFWICCVWHSWLSYLHKYHTT